MDGGSSFFQNFKTRYIHIKNQNTVYISHLSNKFSIFEPPGLPSDISSDPQWGAGGGGEYGHFLQPHNVDIVYTNYQESTQRIHEEIFICSKIDQPRHRDRQILQAKSKRSHVYMLFH